MNAEKLSISLPSDMAQRIRRRVESGSYSSNSEVIREAMRMFEDREAERARQLEGVRARIAEAMDDTRSVADDELGRRMQERFQRAVRNGQ